MTLKEIDAILEAPEHYDSTPTRHYGSWNPVEDAHQLIWRCSHCDGGGRLLFGYPNQWQLAFQGGCAQKERRKRHFVECAGCGRRGRPAAHAATAVTAWNGEHLDLRLSIDEFPFFQLAGLSRDDARAKLRGIRSDLELRRAQSRERSNEGVETGRAYRQRIDAYLAWAILGQAFVKALAPS